MSSSKATLVAINSHAAIDEHQQQVTTNEEKISSVPAVEDEPGESETVSFNDKLLTDNTFAIFKRKANEEKERKKNVKSPRPLQPIPLQVVLIYLYISSTYGHEFEDKAIMPSNKTTLDIIKRAVTIEAQQQQIAELEERSTLHQLSSNNLLAKRSQKNSEQHLPQPTHFKNYRIIITHCVKSAEGKEKVARETQR